jgi:hypothetical protein
MKAAAAAAVGGTAVALGSSERAAAVNGENLVIGNTGTGTGVQVASSPTQLNYTGSEDMAFVVQSGTTFTATNSSFDAAIGGWTSRSVNPIGVYGFSNVTTTSGYGVMGRADGRAGVEGRGNRSTTIGVRGLGGSQSPGVEGTGRDGLAGSGSRYGALLNGNLAALSITTSTAAAPPARTGRTHSAGNIDTSSTAAGPGTSDLWACVTGGTPGTWRRLAGPDTAGALTPINPVRVYDSRVAAPTPGRISSGQNRVVSVADARDTGNGSVIAADAIPVGATAVAYNVTLDATAASGFLSVTPGDAASSPSSSINWSSSNLIIANAGIVKLDGSRQVKVFAGGGGSTHFLIDITGYYL